MYCPPRHLSAGYTKWARACNVVDDVASVLYLGASVTVGVTVCMSVSVSVSECQRV